MNGGVGHCGLFSWMLATVLSSEIDLPIRYVCEVCNGIHSKVSIILKAFQKSDFITE